MTETITREQYMKAYKDAPEIVRAVYDADLTMQIIVGLQAKYQLHVDEAGLLGKGVGHMLLGLVNPQEFLNELIAAKIPENDAREIMTEINQKIFVPLREQMRKGPITAPELTGPTMFTPPLKASEGTARPSVASQPAGVVRPPLQSPTYFHLENKIAHPSPPKSTQGTARPINLAPTAPGGRPALRDVLAAITKTPRPSPEATVGTAKPMDSNKLLEDHEEPHIEFNKAPAVQTTSRTVTPPNLPGALPPRVVSEVRPSPVIPKVEPPAPLAKAQPVPPFVPTPPKPYSGDPYREPIE